VILEGDYLYELYKKDDSTFGIPEPLSAASGFYFHS